MEFVRTSLAPGNGYDATVGGALAYVKANSPVPKFHNCAVPVLELVTYNDCLVHPGRVNDIVEAYKKSSNVVTAVTRQGTHMIRWQGWCPRDWLSVASAEFLEAALNKSVSR